MKKKIMGVALVVALVAIMVGGTLAYFTAEDEVTNTFTIGSVKIEIYENDAPTESDTVEFDKPFVPVVNMTEPSKDESYIKKEVNVKNTGNNAAYIRTHIAIPTALVGYIYLDLDETGWTRQQPDTTATVENVAYTVFTYNYNAELAPDYTTSKLLKGVYLGSDVDLKDNPDTPATEDLEFCIRNQDGSYTYSGFAAYTGSGSAIQGINVLVASEAIQAEGFSDAATALTSGFGTATNPWQP